VLSYIHKKDRHEKLQPGDARDIKSLGGSPLLGRLKDLYSESDAALHGE